MALGAFKLRMLNLYQIMALVPAPVQSEKLLQFKLLHVSKKKKKKEKITLFPQAPALGVAKCCWRSA